MQVAAGLLVGLVMTNSQSNQPLILELDQLACITGGAGAPDTSQAELRKLGQQYCPATSAQFAAAKTITRPMAERCLDEAGYGMFKGRLDQYFPKK
jgi:hypothetical protein